MSNLTAYAKLSDAELNYIIRDAGAAAVAMRTHGTMQGDAAEAKYLDQVNDATTILYRRRTKKAAPRRTVSRDWKCNECGKTMTLAQAERASITGCSKCGGSDIDMRTV